MTFRWIPLRRPRRHSSLPDVHLRPRCADPTPRRVRCPCGRIRPTRTVSPIDPFRCRRRIPAPPWKSSKRSSTRTTLRKRRNRPRPRHPAEPTPGNGVPASGSERSARTGHPPRLPKHQTTLIRPTPSLIRNLKVIHHSGGRKGSLVFEKGF